MTTDTGSPDATPAVDWLVDNSLVGPETGERFVAEHPDPDLP